MEPRGLRLVLTGGIGAGKSAVGEILRRRGVRVIDADRFAHIVLEPGGSGFDEVSRIWPEVIVAGRVDRRRLADIVFREQPSLRLLESLVHPGVRRMISAADAAAGSDPLAVEISVPIVLADGPGWTVMVVDAPEPVRRERLEARGLEPADIERRLSAQPDRLGWLALADVVIDNAGDETDLAHRVEAALVGFGG